MNTRDMLIKMLEIYSPSGEEYEIAKLLRDYMEDLGFPNPVIDEKYNVVSVTGRNKPSILICGHEDTVPGFIDVKIDGDLIYGRGAVDAKSSLLALMLGAKQARDAGFDGRIILAAASGEESDSKGINYIESGYDKTDYAIFGEPGGPENITAGYKGRILMEIKKHSSSHHASSSWMEENSIDSLINLWIKIRDKWGSNKDFNDISAGITKFNGGEYDNMTPENASMFIDIRYPKSVTENDIVSEIKSLAGDSREYIFKTQNRTYPYISDLKSNLVSAFKASIKKNGMVPRLIFKSGSGDMNTLGHDWGIPVVTYGPGDTKLSHTPDEVINYREIDKCAEIVRDSLIYLKNNVFKN
ncbi:M20/M25/M40 family metallo-hydrolase [Acidiplasma sp.]|uniref:M20/M25/M40 family metallo-hydrolase n=1 Tax=Acidiplasma sp. TaxID=1872114 RepID=UPI00258F6486|nr:M20/M25/M40 family metallo-hydrolase [Acidiplasma sp.]